MAKSPRRAVLRRRAAVIDRSRLSERRRNSNRGTRSADEITDFGGKRIAPKGVKVFNPAFDVTPAELVTAIITERGVALPTVRRKSRRAQSKRTQLNFAYGLCRSSSARQSSVRATTSAAAADRCASPSPSRLKPSTASPIATPGAVVRCGATSRKARPAVEHVAPARRGRQHAQSEERQRRLGDDDSADSEGRLHRDRPRDAGHR